MATPIRITFNELMDTSTITDSTILVRQGVAFDGGTPVAGTVSQYSQGAIQQQTVAMFTASSLLADGQRYWVRVVSGASGVKDLAGNVMSTETTWHFDTAPLRLALQDLAAGTYVTFAGKNWIKVFADQSLLMITDTDKPANQVFDPDNTNLYDPADSNNVAHYLNNEWFLALTSDRNWAVNFAWNRQEHRGSDEWIGNYNPVTCKVGLLSIADWNGLSSTLHQQLAPSGSGNYAWTLTPSADTNLLWIVDPGGQLHYLYAADGGAEGSTHTQVRPVVVLQPSISANGGDGSVSNPYSLANM